MEQHLLYGETVFALAEFLMCGAWESGLCSAEALMGYSLLICLKLQLSYFQAAAGGCKFLISSEAETA